MSLIGRLEDLPASDILRIVYLSRGTGALEVACDADRYTVLFRHGLILNASSPQEPSLRSYLELQLGPLKRLHGDVTVAGVAVLETNLIERGELAKLVFKRLSDVIQALCGLRSGQFQFRAVEPSLADIEYDPYSLFRHGGIPLDKILGKNSTPLRALTSIQESIAAGRRQAETEGGPAQVAEPAADKAVVLFGHDAHILGRLRSALSGRGFRVIECSPDDAKATIDRFLSERRFFATALDIEAEATHQTCWRLLDSIKARNARLPVVIVDRESSVRRRHTALQAGADLYLTKPQPKNTKAGIADDEVALLAEDVVLFASREFQRAEVQEGPRVPVADKERMYRGFRMLMQMISEVSEPNDISQLALTILQLAADYVDRGILFAVTQTEFATLGRFGLNGGGARGLRLERGSMAVLDHVMETRQPYRTSVDINAADHQLLHAFGGQTPSEIVVLPIMNGEEIVGLLYGDNALHQRTIDDMVGLEVFLSQAGFVFQNAMVASQVRGAAGAAW